jgi:hypothetical protein
MAPDISAESAPRSKLPLTRWAIRPAADHWRVRIQRNSFSAIQPCYCEGMESDETRDRSNLRHIKRPRRLLSRTRIVMGLLLIVATAIFICLADKAVRENADAIKQILGR